MVMAMVVVRQAVVAGLLAAVAAWRETGGRTGLRAARGAAVAYGAAPLLTAVAHVSTLRRLVVERWDGGSGGERGERET